MLTFCTCVARGCRISNPYGNASSRWNRDTIACSVRRAMLLECSLVRVRNALGSAPPGSRRARSPVRSPSCACSCSECSWSSPSGRAALACFSSLMDSNAMRSGSLVKERAHSILLLYLPNDLALAMLTVAPPLFFPLLSKIMLQIS